MQHLNVLREESVKVIVDYTLNRFAAFLVGVDGFPIIFTTATTWSGLMCDGEFQKYTSEWVLPVECSDMVILKLSQQANSSTKRLISKV